MATRAQSQLAMDETTIEDPQLEASLEAREKAKASKARASLAFKEKDEQAKAQLEEHGLDPDTPLRVGRFRVTKTVTEGRSVSFDTSGSSRVNISTPDD